MPRFVFRAWVRDGNRLHRGLLGKSNVYHTNGYVVRVKNGLSNRCYQAVLLAKRLARVELGGTGMT